MTASSLSPHACPRCARQLHMAQLQVAPAGSITLHGCGGCGGLWLDNASTSAVVARINPQVVSLSQSASKNAQQKQTDLDAAVHCPVCNKALRRVPGGDPSLLIDICDEHGTWFDRDELQQVSALAEKKRRDLRTAGAVGAVGVAATAGAVALQQPNVSNALASVADVAGNVGEVASDVGGSMLEAGVEFVAEVAVEVVFEGICSVIAGIFD